MSTEDYPLTARIRKWDGSAWVVAMFIPTGSIIDVRANYRGYRIEESAKVLAIDRGLITAEPVTQTLIADINAQVAGAYRLDIHAPDQTEQVDGREWASDFTVTGMIYWSGIIARINQNEATASRQIEIEAVGWSTFLDRVVLTDRVYVNETPLDVVHDIVAQVSAQMPGDVALLTVGRGTITSLLIDTLTVKAASATTLLQQVARFGNFTFGLSVSGAGAQVYDLTAIDDDLTNWTLIQNMLTPVASVSTPPLGFTQTESTYLLETDSDASTVGWIELAAGDFEKDGLLQKHRVYVRRPEEGGKTATDFFGLRIISPVKIWADAQFEWVSGVPTINSGDATVTKMDGDWYRVELAYVSTSDSEDESRLLQIHVGDPDIGEATNDKSLTVYAPALISDAEFTLVFYEASFDNDLIAGVAGDFKQQVGMVVDQNGMATVQALIRDKGGNHFNAWDFVGEAGVLDFLSVITESGSPATISDYTFEPPAGDSGVGNWESTLKGMQIRAVDFARRVPYRNQETGEQFPAGGLSSLPSHFLRHSDGELEFRIVEYEEQAAGEGGKQAAFTLERWPGLSVRDLDNQGFRYTVNPAGLQVHRSIEDGEETAAREKVTRLIGDGSVRGEVQAGVFAQQDLYAQEANRRSATVGLRNVRTLPNGHVQRQRNTLVLTGESPNQRMTLYGSVSNSGDAYAKGDDPDRVIGPGRSFEIKRVRMQYKDGGWDAVFDLGAAPAELKASIVPRGISGRGVRR